MRRLRLRSGLELWGLNQTDCEVLYQQIFGLGAYLRHGITLKAGDTVFDVGANVGLFSLWLSEQLAELRLYQFEPAPESFEALAANGTLLRTSKVKAFQVALSDREGTATLTYSPHLSSMATLHPGEEPRTGSLAEWLRATVDDSFAQPPLPLLPAWATGSRGVAYAGALLSAASIAVARALTTRSRTVACAMLSSVLEREAIARVDLLKIDVEGHELEVLRGLREEHWPRVQQLIVEVADLNGRLDAVIRLLEAKGFTVSVAQEPWRLFALHRLRIVYARRAA